MPAIPRSSKPSTAKIPGTDTPEENRGLKNLRIRNVPGDLNRHNDTPQVMA